MAFTSILPEDVVIMKLDGTIIDGIKVPSSENAMHAIVYKNRKDVGGMIHVHSTFAATLDRKSVV